jgi:hypothetical protein
MKWFIFDFSDTKFIPLELTIQIDPHGSFGMHFQAVQWACRASNCVL